MKYGTEYRGAWLMANDATIIGVSIFDTENLIDDAADVEVIPVETSGNPLNISIIDNNKDKFSPIKSRQAKIEILTTSEIGFETFGGSDNRWYVQIIANPSTTNTTLFLGYLSLADNQEDFLPDPNVLVLTATDHLGMLKDIPLTNDDGTNVEYKHKIGELIALAVKKTGLSLPIKVVNNLRFGGLMVSPALFQFYDTNQLRLADTHANFFYIGQTFTVTGSDFNDGTYHVTAKSVGSGSVVVTLLETITTENALAATLNDPLSLLHLYDGVYLDAKTFEAEINECEDCYTVLEKILGEDCFITQYQGEWWIYRIDEFDDHAAYVASFDEDGNYLSITSTFYNIAIGSNETFKPVNADMLLSADRPHGVAKLTFNYEYPKEIPCNVDFSRGEYIEDLPDEVIEDETFTAKSYEFDCWDLREGVPNNYGTPDGTEVYLKRLFNGVDYESERYIVLTPRTTFESSTIDDVTYIESQPIPIIKKDKFNVSVDWRLESDIATGGNGNARLLRAILIGDDGSGWILGSELNGTNENIWYDTAGWTTNTAKGGVSIDYDDNDETEWSGVSFDAAPAPVSGTIYLWLNQFNQTSGSDDNLDIYYSNLQFTYIPYINGSYQKYSGQYQKVSREITKYLAKREKDVFVSDSPKPLLKGAMFFQLLGDLFTGNVVFQDGNAFQIDGDYTATFREGMFLVITGTLFNNITARITDVYYSIVADETVVTLSETTVSETVAGAVFQYYIFKPANVFYQYNIYYNTEPALVAPYGEFQIRSVFNQYRNGNRIFDGSFNGLYHVWPDLINKYLLTDNNPNTDDRYFIMTSFEQNWKTGFFTATFIECYNTDGRNYDDDREFKYITNG